MRSHISRWFRKLCPIGTAIYVVSFLCLLAFPPSNKNVFASIFGLFHTPPHIIAGVCCFVYALRGQHATRQLRLGWLLVGLSCFFYTTGDIFYCYYESKGRVPCPSWADAGWLAVFPFVICGVLLLLRGTPRAGRIRLLLDSAIATSSVGVFVWYFVLAQLWHRSGTPFADKLTSIQYPLGDVASLFCAFVLLKSKQADPILRRSSWLLASGIILWSFSDTLYTFQRFLGHYEVGTWFDWGWPFGAILIAYACLVPMWNQNTETADPETSLDEQAEHSRSAIRLMAPYVAAGASLAVVLSCDYADGNGISQSTLVISLGILLLVMARQVFTLTENRFLTGQLSDQLTYNQELTGELTALNEEINATNQELGALNSELEQRVEQRTKQVGALLELTQAVNLSLAVDDVLAAALHHTQQAMQTDAVMIWLREGIAPDTLGLPVSRGLENQPEMLSLLRALPVHDQMERVRLDSENSETKGEAGCLRAPIFWQQQLLGMVGVASLKLHIEPTDQELLRSIGLEIGTALTNASRHQAALDAADKDPLTGLHNHRAIHHLLDQALESDQTEGESVAVLMLDLNNFRMFNDTYGHPTGDLILKQVAAGLRDVCQSGGYAGRYGGDEFLLVLPFAGQSEAVAQAEQLRQRMMGEGFRRPGEERVVPIELSFGIAVFPEDSTNRHELLTVADSNLYAAKQSEGGIRASTEMQRSNRELRALGTFDVLDAMVTAVDNKDSYTRRHSEDVTEYALWTAEELGVSDESLRTIRMAGLLHDVGKIGVPDEILRKPGRLTQEEYEVMKRHPHLGALIVDAVMDNEQIVEGVRSHHERWDGKGYPDGTAGEATPFLGRLLAIADAFSAMTTDRPYRKGMDWEVALKEIEANVGTQFDPALTPAFLKAVRKRQKPQSAITPLLKKAA